MNIAAKIMNRKYQKRIAQETFSNQNYCNTYKYTHKPTDTWVANNNTEHFKEMCNDFLL